MRGRLLIFLFIFAFAGVKAQLPEMHAGRAAHNSGGDTQHTSCSGVQALSVGEFTDELSKLRLETYDEGKLTQAKQIAGSSCLTVGQIAEICKTFGFEESKLSFAEFAYDHCTEPQNYGRLSTVFAFSSNADELTKYVQSRQ